MVYIGDLLSVIGRDGETWSDSPTNERQNSTSISTVKKTVSILGVDKLSVPAFIRSPVARRNSKESGVDLASAQPTDGAKISSADATTFLRDLKVAFESFHIEP